MSNTSSKSLFKLNYLDEIDTDLLNYIMDMSKIRFFDNPVTYGRFFKENELFTYGSDSLDKENIVEIILTGKSGMVVSLRTHNGNIYYLHDNEETNKLNKGYLIYYDKNTDTYPNDIITSLKIKYYKKGRKNVKKGRENVILDTDDIGYRERKVILDSSGGSKAPPVKKEVCGRLRCIYTIAGSRKEHIKYKGQLITVADYKKVMKKV